MQRRSPEPRGVADRMEDATGWKRPFDDPIRLANGRQIVTLEDAGAYITELPKADQQLDEWQIAIEALMLVVKQNGPTMFARMGGVEPSRRTGLQS
jgi:hypothetical protein